MLNIAVIVSVSKYDVSGNNLPGCEQDGTAIKSLVELSGRFSDIHYVSGHVQGSEVKSNIADFLHQFVGQSIGDVLFYFSGHGEYFDNEFYYLLSNYSPNKRRQSSLDNTEIDKMVRPLTPNMFVKIVDACHSGTPYIKDSSSLEHYLKSTSASSFKNLCFMFSSQQSEFSYQDSSMSYFTKSIVSAVFNHKNGPIKYKNITDYVSDDFGQLNTQTPFFIDQSSLTEIFITVTDEIRDALAGIISVTSNDNDNDNDITNLIPQRSMSLVDILKKDSDSFCTKEEASAIITNSEGYIHNGPFSPEIKELYDVKIDAEISDYPPQPKSIATWIEKNNEGREFFARPVYRREPYKRRSLRNPLLAAMLPSSASDLSSDLYVDVTDYRNILDGYESTSSMPYKYFQVSLIPKYRSLTPEDCFIAFIVSRSNIRFFWSFSHYEYTDWDVSQRIGKMEWVTDVALLNDKDRIEIIYSRIIADYCRFVEEPLRSKWGEILVPDNEIKSL